ncbi:hypothetical protein ACFLXY_00575 [Chloroflexota bacterium]
MEKHLHSIIKILVIIVLLTSVIGIASCRSEESSNNVSEKAPFPNTENATNLPRPIACPGTIPDGDGGALVIYAEFEQDNGQVIHVQRIDRSGELLWDKELGKGYSFMGDHLKLISDGNGGVITYSRVSPVDEPGWGDETIFRVSFEGNVVWRTSLPVNRRIETITPDGAGGAIFSYRDSGQQNNCYIQKVDSQGHLLWGEDELLLRRDNYQFRSVRLISDDSEGAIITWHERGDNPVSRVCAQRVDGNGTFLWEGQSRIKKGKVLYTTERITEGQQGEMIGDGSGGVLLAWIENNWTPPILYHVTAMHIDPDGISKWESHTELGTEVSTSGYVAFPFVIRDSTETFLFWSNVNTIYAQKLDESGEPLWPNNGIVVWQDPDSLRLSNQVVNDGFGGVFIVWSYIKKEPSPQGTKLGIQKLNLDGTIIWNSEGKPVETLEKTFSTLSDVSPDGEGGVFVTWTSGTEMGTTENTYIQKINEDGVPIWESGGIKLGR